MIMYERITNCCGAALDDYAETVADANNGVTICPRCGEYCGVEPARDFTGNPYTIKCPVCGWAYQPFDKATEWAHAWTHLVQSPKWKNRYEQFNER